MMANHLYSKLSQSPKAVECVPYEKRSDVIIIFTGKQPDLSAPRFNLVKGTIHWPLHKIYVKDINNSWYHGEHPEIGGGIINLKEHLEEFLQELSYSNVYTVGGSMGGYAAMLYGCLLEADVVSTFGPQTFIDKWNRLKSLDFRSMAEKRKLYQYASSNPDFFDLKKVLAATKNLPEIHIHIGRKNRIDQYHVKHLGNYPSIKIHLYETKRHDISIMLKRQNKLYDTVLNDLDINTNLN